MVSTCSAVPGAGDADTETLAATHPVPVALLPLLTRALYQASSFSSPGHARCVELLWLAGAGAVSFNLDGASQAGANSADCSAHAQRSFAAPGGLNALHRAAERGALPSAAELLRCASVFGSNLSPEAAVVETDAGVCCRAVAALLRSEDRCGRRPLYWACRNGHVDVVELLYAAAKDACHGNTVGVSERAEKCMEKSSDLLGVAQD